MLGQALNWFTGNDLEVSSCITSCGDLKQHYGFVVQFSIQTEGFIWNVWSDRLVRKDSVFKWHHLVSGDVSLSNTVFSVSFRWQRCDKTGLLSVGRQSLYLQVSWCSPAAAAARCWHSAVWRGGGGAVTLTTVSRHGAQLPCRVWALRSARSLGVWLREQPRSWADAAAAELHAAAVPVVGVSTVWAVPLHHCGAVPRWTHPPWLPSNAWQCAAGGGVCHREGGILCAPTLQVVVMGWGSLLWVVLLVSRRWARLTARVVRVAVLLGGARHSLLAVLVGV